VLLVAVVPIILCMPVSIVAFVVCVSSRCLILKLWALSLSA